MFALFLNKLRTRLASIPESDPSTRETHYLPPVCSLRDVTSLLRAQVVMLLGARRHLVGPVGLEPTIKFAVSILSAGSDCHYT